MIHITYKASWYDFRWYVGRLQCREFEITNLNSGAVAKSTSSARKLVELTSVSCIQHPIGPRVTQRIQVYQVCFSHFFEIAIFSCFAQKSPSFIDPSLEVWHTTKFPLHARISDSITMCSRPQSTYLRRHSLTSRLLPDILGAKPDILGAKPRHMQTKLSSPLFQVSFIQRLTFPCVIQRIQV